MEVDESIYMNTDTTTLATERTIDRENIKKQTYKQIKLLGQGSYGKAYLVECSLDKV